MAAFLDPLGRTHWCCPAEQPSGHVQPVYLLQLLTAKRPRQRMIAMKQKDSLQIPEVKNNATDVSENGPSRREFLVQGTRAAAGVGIAALLGNLGHWALSYAADKEPIKIGVLHSLSGTMAISEVSLRDVVLMAVWGIKGQGGGFCRQIQPGRAGPPSHLES